MKLNMRHGLLITIATLLSTAVLVVAFLFIGQYTMISEGPGDYLPSEHVLGLLHNPTPENKNAFQAWFPELAYLQDNNEEAIAVLALPNGRRGTVSFVRGTAGTGMQKGNYGLRLSDPELAPLLESPAKLLSNDEAYGAINRRHEHKDSWLYLDSRAVTSGETLRDHLTTALLFSGTGFGLTLSDKGVQIDSYSEYNESALPMDGISLLPESFLSFAEQDVTDRFRTVLAGMQQSEQMILEGLVRSFMTKHFGQSVSLEYDLLPLLTQSTQLQLKTQSGGISFVLQGRGTSPEQVEEILGRFHDSIRATLPTARMNTRTFDERFPSTVIESDPELIVEEENTIGPWKVRATRHRDDPEKFLTGLNGYRFVISNDASALENVLMSRGESLSVGHISDTGTITGAGRMDLAVMKGLLDPILPADGQTSLLIFPESGALTWVTQRSGRVHSLLLLPESAPIPLDSGADTSTQ